MSPLRPFFCFYGGKWRDAARYPPPLGEVIVEPFAGAAGYSVRHASRRVVLVDLDPVIVGVWDYLIRASEAEVLAIPDLLAWQTTDDLPVCQEARWLVGFWLNRAAAPRRSPSSWMRSGVRPGSFWGDRVRQTIASQLQAIRHWTVRLGSWESTGALPTRPTTYFVDPPYQHAGTHYRCGADRIDFGALGALGAWSERLPGQVVVCEQVGATWLPFRPLGEAVKTTRRGKRSAEAVWVGGDF